MSFSWYRSSHTGFPPAAALEIHLLLAYGQQSSHRAGTTPEHHEIRPRILAAGRWPTRCAARSRFPGSTLFALHLPWFPRRREPRCSIFHGHG